MSRPTFDAIVEILERDPIFTSTGKKPQRPVKFQLASFLLQYGRHGGDSLDPATKLALGHGSVFLYCKRVVWSLRNLKTRYVRWPNRARRAEIKAAIEEKTGFPNVIGIVDGCLIPFVKVPAIDPHIWFTRKKFPGVSERQVYP